MKQIEQGSFRDPSGFIYYQDDVLYRQINCSYKENYDEFISSGLYEKLVDDALIVKHTECDSSAPDDQNVYKIIQPEYIPSILYPFEWCFSQYRDAAIATLRIQRIALEHNMSLKDASAFNIQFMNGAPLLIDTLSFEKYEEGKPWVAYKQFCQHFLAPLYLIKYIDVGYGQLMKQYVDGVPLTFASKLLPRRTWLSIAPVFHIHIHARMQSKYADRGVEVNTFLKQKTFSKNAIFGLIDQLESAIIRLKWKHGATEWGDYYIHTNYSEQSFQHKKDICDDSLVSIQPTAVIDIGANEGTFSRIAAEHAKFVLSADIDPVAVELNYFTLRKDGQKNVLPLLIDLTNPSPGIGWANTERRSFLERINVDTVMALALIHHLSISNNIPFGKIAHLFSLLGRNLIIEFIPKSDSQVQKLLSTREDIFYDYNQESFESAFLRFFSIEEKKKIVGSERILYRMKAL